MKKAKKLIALLLAVVLCLGLFAGCGGGGEPAPAPAPEGEEPAPAPEGEEPSDAPVDLSAMEYDDASAYVYDEALGEFWELYQPAKQEVDDIDLRYALMAQAEAKLMEAAVMVPTQTQGGNYAMSRTASRTNSTVTWGNDSERYHNMVVTTDLIKSEDQDHIRNMWYELAGTGTFEQSVKDYLTEQGYTLQDQHSIGYSSDPVTWDVLATSRAADTDAILNTYCGLAEYDNENVQQPALATSWEISDDGLTYTFHIREGVKWVDSQGREVADLVADDWVASLQHLCDAMGGLEYLLQGVIKGVNEYINGEITDFSEVGVKAIDDHTLEYTLEARTPYFLSMLSYGVLAPMSRSYYVSQGGKFGLEYDYTAADYTYGKTPDNIAYCGPYLVTNATATNTIVFDANPAYWDKDNINIHKITWLYNDGSDPLKSYNDCKSGILTGTALTASSLEAARKEMVPGTDKSYFDTYNYTSLTTATTFSGFYNLNRQAFANAANESEVISAQTPEMAARTNAAIRNVHFRRAISFGLDRAAYNAVTVGEELRLNALRNSYTPGNFISLANEVTIDINGESRTFPAGTWYGEIMQAQIDADGVAMKVWDPEGEGGAGSGDGFDGWYNPDNAMAELEIAIEELAAQGVEVSPENPIYLDLPYPANSDLYTNRANVWKQSVEASCGGCVVVSLTVCNDADEWYGTGYDCNYGYESNYDIYDLSGWGPDYGDPATYLDTFQPEYGGYMTKCIGVY